MEVKELFTAIEEENLEGVKSYVKAGGSLNCKFNVEEAYDDESVPITPLEFAYEIQNWEVIRLLLENGADINQEFQDIQGGGIALLHDVCRDVSRKFIKFCVDHGADVNAKASSEEEEFKGKTPLMVACTWRSDDLFEVVSLLVEHGADVNASDPNGQTALMLLIEAALKRATPKNFPNPEDRKTIKLLLEAGVDIEAADNEGRTAMRRAKKADDLRLAEFLEVV